MENGTFPPNGRGAIHPNLQGCGPANLFTTQTPLGGVWDRDYSQNGFTASISVRQDTASNVRLPGIDGGFADGNLSTGFIQVISSRVVY